MHASRSGTWGTIGTPSSFRPKTTSRSHRSALSTPPALYDPSLRPTTPNGTIPLNQPPSDWKNDDAMAEWNRRIKLRRKEERLKKGKQEEKEMNSISVRIENQKLLEKSKRKQADENGTGLIFDSNNLSKHRVNKFQITGNMLRLQSEINVLTAHKNEGYSSKSKKGIAKSQGVASTKGEKNEDKGGENAHFGISNSLAFGQQSFTSVAAAMQRELKWKPMPEPVKTLADKNKLIDVSVWVGPVYFRTHYVYPSLGHIRKY